eukprot:scaffold3710_cov286-Chaetoceros_neogracile.AAC.20
MALNALHLMSVSNFCRYCLNRSNDDVGRFSQVKSNGETATKAAISPWSKRVLSALWKGQT